MVVARGRSASKTDVGSTANEERLSNQLDNTACLLDLPLGLERDESCFYDEGELGELSVAQDLSVAVTEGVDHGNNL